MFKIKIITINLPEKYLEDLQILIEKGFYPSRSEALRIALRDFLANELKFYDDLENSNFKELISQERNPN